MANPLDPFGVKKAQKEQKRRLDQQAADAAEVKEEEIEDRVSRATNQLFRSFGAKSALGGGLGRPGILG